MKRDKTYFIIGSNTLRFEKITWYKNEYDGMFIVMGNSGDFWFEVFVEYPEKYFDLHRWMNDQSYQYKAYSKKTPSEIWKNNLKLYEL